MIDWKAIGVGFIVTLILALIGVFVPFLAVPIAPIIGGIMAGYMVGGSYRNGIINGGLSAGLAGFIYALLVMLLFGAVISALIASLGVSISGGIVVAIGLLVAIIFFIINFILGLIGGIIGVAIKGRGEEKTTPETPEQMKSRKSPEIPFNKENFTKCLCPTCPVQGESDCAKEKLMNMQELMQNEDEILEPKDFPGMYCTNGKATCTDIDTEQYCICEDCPVHKLYDLDHAEPTFLYCKDGKAM